MGLYHEIRRMVLMWSVEQKHYMNALRICWFKKCSIQILGFLFVYKERIVVVVFITCLAMCSFCSFAIVAPVIPNLLSHSLSYFFITITSHIWCMHSTLAWLGKQVGLSHSNVLPFSYNNQVYWILMVSRILEKHRRHQNLIGGIEIDHGDDFTVISYRNLTGHHVVI